MKSILALTFALLSIQLVYSHKVNYQTPDLKPGDWFECEMEFENGVPVFRNHWIPDDDSTRNSELISLRFTFQGTSTDSVENWDYKILRYKEVLRSELYKNIRSYDTWYPSIYQENYDEFRKSLKGKFKFKNNLIVDHIHSNILENRKERSKVSTSIYSKKDDKFYVTALNRPNNPMAELAENVASILFCLRNPSENKKYLSKGYVIDNFNMVNRNQFKFTINPKLNRSKQSDYTMFVKNQFPFAIKGKYKQKVILISKSSFLPKNKGVVIIEDKRILPDSSLNFDNFISFASFNPFSITNSNYHHFFIRSESNIFSTEVSLKTGTQYYLNGRIPGHWIYLEPEDTLTLTITDNGTKVVGNRNNKWWLDESNTWWKEKYNWDIKKINSAPISEEFKAYLRLETSILKKYKQLWKMKDSDSIQNSILSLYFLKNYHYYHIDNLLNAYKKRIDNLNHKNGVPRMHSNFQHSYHTTISNYIDFPLYILLGDLMSGPRSHQQFGRNPEVFNSFFKQCGDTLLTSKIRNKLIGHSAVQPGKKLPFKSFVTENDQIIDPMFGGKKYKLLLLYFDKYKHENLLELRKLLNPNIQTISYKLSYKTEKNSLIKYDLEALSDSTHIDLFGHPKQSVNFYNKFSIRFYPLIILYNKKGKILYSKIIDRNSDIKLFKNEIEEVILEDQKHSENKILELLIIILVAISLTIGISLPVYRYRIKRIKKRTTREKLIEELKLKSVQSQLNPHFLFNALNSIQGLMNTKKYDEADKYLIGLSELLRGVLGNSDKRLVSLKDELDIVERYCDLEKLRTPFTCTLDIKTGTDISILEVPYMLLQPLVENAIKHGILKSGEAGVLSIRVREEDSILNIIISDNGSGIGEQSLDALKQKGRGLNLTMEKLKSTFGNDSTFSIRNKNGDKGTEITIKLNIG